MATYDISPPLILPMESTASPSVWRRLPSALRRRVRSGWSQWVIGPRPPMAASAIDRLKQLGQWQFDDGQRLPLLAGDSQASVALTATCAATLWTYGQRLVVRRWLDLLLDRQLDCGAFAAIDSVQPSLIETAQVMRALASLDAASPRVGEAVARGCEFLASCIDAEGAIHDVHDMDRGGDRSPLVAHLACLPPLLMAAQKCHETAWEDATWRALARFRRSVDLTRWQAPSPWFAATIQSLCELDQQSLARQALVLPSALQRRDGSVPALPRASWVLSEGLARLAAIWFSLGDRCRGDRAMAALRTRQLPNGGFARGWGRGSQLVERESTAAACHVLAAAAHQVQAAFATSASEFEATIDPRDGRVAALAESLEHLPAGAHIADVGCGKGRFLRALMARYPQYHWTGIDVSSEMLAHLPTGVISRQGNLLNLSEPDGKYDAAFAVESLEHALLPEQAVGELARIVRPGGRVVIIDKHRQRQPLSEHDPWEQWFAPEEVRTWLSHDCESVDVRPIPHGAHTAPTGLFLCWTAERRTTVRSQAA